MENHEIEITICMGSSCFSRGNKKTLEIIKEFLKETERYDMVTFKGAHCFGNCENGPVLKINDTVYTKVSDDSLENILENFFQSLK